METVRLLMAGDYLYSAKIDDDICGMWFIKQKIDRITHEIEPKERMVELGVTGMDMYVNFRNIVGRIAEEHSSFVIIDYVAFEDVLRVMSGSDVPVMSFILACIPVDYRVVFDVHGLQNDGRVIYVSVIE
jgi:hypothetical protein